MKPLFRSVRSMRSVSTLGSFLALTLLLAGPVLPTGSRLDQEPEGTIPDLPVAISSFGAALLDGAIYVFGGHTGRAHQHSFENLSQLFLRHDLDGAGPGWQALPPGPAVQGVALVAHRDHLYRVGGLRADNPRGVEEDLRSLATAERFDPRENRWQALPELPVGRSSHDLTVVGDRLLVAGGWQMRGKDEEPQWQRAVLALDLARLEHDPPAAAWTELTRIPEETRANAAVGYDGRLWVIGGIGKDGGVRRQVHVYDLETDRWSEGPELPETGRLQGFGAAAVVAGDSLLVSPFEGGLYRLGADQRSWERVGTLETPRFFHRLVTDGDHLFAIGGATRQGHLVSVERHRLAALGLAGVEATSAARSSPGRERGRWSSFRNGGPNRADAELALSWSPEAVAWSVELPGFGHSSPVVWDDVVYVTSVTGEQKDRLWLTAISLADGVELWRRSWPASETMESNDMLARAAPTPAIDGERIVLFFGSGDLFAVDHSGNRLWHRDLASEYGTFVGNHGVGNSVLLAQDTAVVLLGRRTYSYLLAVDVETGRNRWKADRDPGVSWTTPVLSPDGSEVVISSNGSVEGYDLETGERLWWMDGVTSNTIASPLVTDELILVAGSDAQANFALRRGTRGKLDGDEVAWRSSATAYFASPVLAAECALWVNKAGAVRCVDPKGGAVKWTHRLPEPIWATPIVADDRVYFFGENGSSEILAIEKDGPRVLARNRVDLDAALSAAVAVESTLLLRAGRKLLAIRPG